MKKTGQNSKKTGSRTGSRETDGKRHLKNGKEK